MLLNLTPRKATEPATSELSMVLNAKWTALRRNLLSDPSSVSPLRPNAKSKRRRKERAREGTNKAHENGAAMDLVGVRLTDLLGANLIVDVQCGRYLAYYIHAKQNEFVIYLDQCGNL